MCILIGGGGSLLLLLLLLLRLFLPRGGGGAIIMVVVAVASFWDTTFSSSSCGGGAATLSTFRFLVFFSITYGRYAREREINVYTEWWYVTCVWESTWVNNYNNNHHHIARVLPVANQNVVTRNTHDRTRGWHDAFLCDICFGLARVINVCNRIYYIFYIYIYTHTYMLQVAVSIDALQFAALGMVGVVVTVSGTYWLMDRLKIFIWHETDATSENWQSFSI